MAEEETIELYDLLGKLNSPIQHIGGTKATENLLEMLNIGSDTKVLDVGCGSGYTACQVAQTYNCKVVGIDASEIMIKQAKKQAQKLKITDMVEFRVADVFELPFESGIFDCAFFESFLNVLTGDRSHAMREIVRVVRSGGKVGGIEVFAQPDIPSSLKEQIFEIIPFLGTAPTLEALKNLFTTELSTLQVVDYPASHVDSRMVLRDSTKTMGTRRFLTYIFRMMYYAIKELKLRQYSKYSRLVMRDEETRKYFGYALITGTK